MELHEVIDLARARPWAHLPWAAGLLDSFPGVLTSAVARWDLTVERAHLDGAGLPVLEVRRGGVPAVLTFDGVGREQAHLVRILQAADGHGYVRVLDHDPELGTALLERLGEPLARAVPDPAQQTEILCDLLEQAWELPLEVGSPTRPEEKAHGLLGILEHGLQDGATAARHRAVLERAHGLATGLARSPQAQQVVVHGDAHSLNVLRRRRGGAEGFALIDPDGFRCEREYDAGVVLRDHGPLLAQIALAEGPAAARRWHGALVDRIAARLGLDRDRVEAWAFVERVTTGVHLGRLGSPAEGSTWLRSAEVFAPPPS